MRRVKLKMPHAETLFILFLNMHSGAVSYTLDAPRLRAIYPVTFHRPSPIITVAPWPRHSQFRAQYFQQNLVASLLDEMHVTNAALTRCTVDFRKLSSHCSQQQGTRGNMASTSSLIIFRCLQVGCICTPWAAWCRSSNSDCSWMLLLPSRNSSPRPLAP
jgi:hypothetical protein